MKRIAVVLSFVLAFNSGLVANAAVKSGTACKKLGITSTVSGIKFTCIKYGSKLIIDETHTISAGAGGMTSQLGLKPDFFVIGKAIGGGIPTGTFGMTHQMAAEIAAKVDREVVDTGGVGGTLAGNPLSVAAMRATLEHVLTEDAFEKMIKLATVFTAGVNELFDKYQLPWSINQLGTRAEYRFAKPYPINGTAAFESADAELEDFLHLYLANRGVLLTPFHNMALMCPTTTLADVQRHHEVFEAAIAELVA